MMSASVWFCLTALALAAGCDEEAARAPDLGMPADLAAPGDFAARDFAAPDLAALVPDLAGVDFGPSCNLLEVTGLSCQAEGTRHGCMASFDCQGQAQTVTCEPLDQGRCVFQPSGRVCYTVPDLTLCTACRDALENCGDTPF
jgi:hypothetical protein